MLKIIDSIPRSISRRRKCLGRLQLKASPPLLRHGLLTKVQLEPRRDPQRRTFFTSARRDLEAFHSQLEEPSSAPIIASLQTSPAVPQTLTEKIVQRYSVDLPKDKHVKAGDYISLSPYRVMTHDNSWPVALKFMSIGASKIHDPSQVVMTLDHDVQNKSDTNLQKYRQIEEFAKKQGTDFYPAGRGIGHQVCLCVKKYTV